MQTITIEETVARRFRLANAPTLLFSRRGFRPWLSRGCATRAIPWAHHGSTAEEAFEFQVALAPMFSAEIWVSGNYTKLHQVSPGDTFVFDLNTNPNGNLSPPYDSYGFISL